MGAVILFPSLGLLFGLLLRGRFDAPGDGEAAPQRAGLAAIGGSAHALYARISIAGLLGGLGFLTAAEAPWAHGVGVACLFACIIFAFLAVDPAELAKPTQDRAAGAAAATSTSAALSSGRAVHLSTQRDARCRAAAAPSAAIRASRSTRALDLA